MKNVIFCTEALCSLTVKNCYNILINYFHRMYNVVFYDSSESKMNFNSVVWKFESYFLVKCENVN